MNKEKELYYVKGKYLYNGIWNEVPSPCKYFYSYSNKQNLTLKGLIAKHLKLSPGEYLYIKLSSNIKIRKYSDLSVADIMELKGITIDMYDSQFS